MTPDEQLRVLPTPPRTGGIGGGNGSLVNHRLAALESRMDRLEGLVKEVNDICIEIRTKLDEKANKSYVLTIFALTGGIAILTLVGHLIIRNIG